MVRLWLSCETPWLCSLLVSRVQGLSCQLPCPGPVPFPVWSAGTQHLQGCRNKTGFTFQWLFRKETGAQTGSREPGLAGPPFSPARWVQIVQEPYKGAFFLPSTADLEYNSLLELVVALRGALGLIALFDRLLEWIFFFLTY